MAPLADIPAAQSPAAALSLRLYVAGDAPNSVLARSNLQSILARHCREQHDLEVVDCLREPQRALRDGVLVTPTLVRLFPKPERLIVGTLSNMDKVVAALDLPVHDQSGTATGEGSHAGESGGRC